jgi:DNA mismatch repair protein MutS
MNIETLRSLRPDQRRGPGPAEDGRVTPMMAQYVEIKAANPDCMLFYRMGDFYELFFEDAEIASRALGIVLTKRGKHQGQDIPMCGVPVERADDYLQRLIALGHRGGGLRADGGSRGGEEARVEVRGAPRTWSAS